MKRRLLSCLLILSLFLCGLPGKASFAEDYKYAVVDGDYVRNISPQLNAPHYINGFCFSEMRCYWQSIGYFRMACKVTNILDVERYINVGPEIYVYDDTGMLLTHMKATVSESEPGKSAYIYAGTMADCIGDAYDYDVVFSEADILDPDEEIVIKKGIICTLHEMKEHDTVTLICEESAEWVRYQWFWSDTRSGEGNLIEGATERRLTLPDVSLDQNGRYYYCLIHKKVKKEYTDRFELVIASEAVSTPAVAPTRDPAASMMPSPTAAASPTPDAINPTAEPVASVIPTANPTVEPTMAATARPVATVNPLPSAAPDVTGVPGVPAAPDSSNSQGSSPSAPDSSPEPTVSPDITANPEQSLIPSPTANPSSVPDIAPNPSSVPEAVSSPEVSPDVSPSQIPAFLKVKKIRVWQTRDLKVKLAWQKIAAYGIAVLRAEKKNGPYRMLKQLSGDRTNYTDKTVKRGKTYYYKIAAHNGDLQVQLSQKDLPVKKITVRYLMPPDIIVTKGNSGGQKYVQIFLRKYEGKYADIFMKTDGNFKKLTMRKRTIKAYRRRYRFRYRRGGVTLYFCARTYRIVKGRKRTSSYSGTVKIKI